MSISLKEINYEAQKLIDTIFFMVPNSDNKEVWEKAFDAMLKKIWELENWDRWKELFIWDKAYKILISKYWKKFITKKKVW